VKDKQGDTCSALYSIVSIIHAIKTMVNGTTWINVINHKQQFQHSILQNCT